LLATAGIAELSVWRLDGLSRERPIVIAGTGDDLTGVSFGPDDALATSTVDGTVGVWSLFRPDAPLATASLDAPAVACAWSPDGTLLAVASGDTVHAFSAP
jgi:WD40 repeat protein